LEAKPRKRSVGNWKFFTYTMEVVNARVCSIHLSTVSTIHFTRPSPFLEEFISTIEHNLLHNEENNNNNNSNTNRALTALVCFITSISLVEICCRILDVAVEGMPCFLP
jgi:hypothetical protein